MAKWIPISERIPTRRDGDRSGKVWVTSLYGGNVTKVPWDAWGFQHLDHAQYLAWMPCEPTPEPYVKPRRFMRHGKWISTSEASPSSSDWYLVSTPRAERCVYVQYDSCKGQWSVPWRDRPMPDGYVREWLLPCAEETTQSDNECTSSNDGWLLPSDIMPTTAGYVMITLKSGHVIAGYWSRGSRQWFTNRDNHIADSEVLAWRTFPPPYNEPQVEVRKRFEIRESYIGKPSMGCGFIVWDSQSSRMVASDIPTRDEAMHIANLYEEMYACKE